MDRGYRELEDGEVIQAGDEALSPQGEEWHDVRPSSIGTCYIKECDENSRFMCHRTMRRKIKQPSETVGVFDATSHANDEWPDEATISKTETVVDSSEMEHTTDWVNGFPPIGSDVYVRHFDGDDELVTVVAYDDEIVIYKPTDIKLDYFYDFSHKENFINPIKSEQTELEREIEMIEAYLEQIESYISDYDVQMFAQYVINHVRGK